MTICWSWFFILLHLQAASVLAQLQGSSPRRSSRKLTLRTSSELASAQFAQIGPIVAGVLGGLSAILLLLLVFHIRRRYRGPQPANSPGQSGLRRTKMSKFNPFRLFGGKRQPSRSASSYWEKDLEAFPRPMHSISKSMIAKPIVPSSPSSTSFTNRPLPAVPAVTRPPTPEDESEGAPLLRPLAWPIYVPSASQSINVRNPSRTKLRVRPDPMLISGPSSSQPTMLSIPPTEQFEERRRQDLAGSTPARRSYVAVPPPMPTGYPPVPPGLEPRHGPSRSETVSSSPLAVGNIASTRSRSRSDGERNQVERSNSSPSAAVPLSQETAPRRSDQHTSRRELTRSLHEAQEAVAMLEGLRSGSTIDLPPLTSHSRFFSSLNDAEQLQAEIEILQREVRRLQTLLLGSRRVSIDGPEGETSNDPNPPPMYRA
ncbi:hypothetical protein B0H10DRAFT_1940095 [Mycena sp. CBHHK59/15]|nr:hypothetical protein B0H10DRAFT_1940095 [Mycena sp. CBHHK59/15]